MRQAPPRPLARAAAARRTATLLRVTGACVRGAGDGKADAAFEAQEAARAAQVLQKRMLRQADRHRVGSATETAAAAERERARIESAARARTHGRAAIL